MSSKKIPHRLSGMRWTDRVTSMEIEAGSAAVADEPARMNVIRPVARDRIMNRVAMRAVCNDAGNYATPGGAGRILLALDANKGWSAGFRACVKNWNRWHGPLARSTYSSFSHRL